MAFVKDVLNAIGDNCLDYKITLLGDIGLICEGFKSVIKFSQTEVLLRLGKALVEIKGSDFVIGEMAQGYLQLMGKVQTFTRLNWEASHGQ